jgi:enamine deaminase RidA (YjgF/YER057c/UK114 family)
MTAMSANQKISDLGLVLPAPMQVPAGVELPFRFTRTVGDRVYIAGHLPQQADGSLAQPIGKVGDDITVDQAYQSARNVALSILGSLQRELGDLDRITAWGKLFGMVNCAPDFTRQPQVINGCSDLILEVFGSEIGAHARSAVGMSSLPFNVPVEVEGEVIIRT